MKLLPMPMAPVQIAHNELQRHRIYRFRYETYVQEMGKRLAYADHSRRFLQEPEDENSALFFVEADTEIIATCRVVFGCDTPIPISSYERLGMADLKVMVAERSR